MNKKNKKRRTLFTRLTLIMVLGTFVLLLLSILMTFGLTAIIAQYWHVDENSIILFGLAILAISLLIGFLLSFVFSAIMNKATEPYFEAVRRIAECDFSVRVKDKPIMSNLGIADRLNSMAEQLGSVETLREEFVSDFSHEFKTPIVSIAGFARLLKNRNISEEERNEYLDVIIDESNRLVQLSESVLSLSRLDSQTLTNETFLLDEQLRQCVLLFARQCSEKNISLEADLDEVSVFNEKKLLSQIWVNLLSNAVKFTQEGGKITVSCKNLGEKVEVKIADDGCGMDEATKSKIFDKFYQGDKSHTTEGNGLGLSVVQKACELLNLKIDVESALGEGSIFTVTIPNAVEE